MANRTVSVNLIANIGQYVSGMNAAAGATMRLGEAATGSTKQARSGFDLASKGAVLMGAAVVGGMAVAVSKSMEFEKAMSAAAAATRVTGSALGDLREAAMKAGADTQYSATEAAQAITEMGKAGVSTADILGGGLNGALALAAAGQIDVAEAAEIASVAMTQFKLEGDKLPHVADLLAAGAGKAMGSVGDLGMALNQAGLVASSSGLSIEETTGTLSAFASAGLIGSDAGTSFRSMLQHLQNPSKESAEAMGDLGISLYDAQGSFVGMEGLAGQLQTSMANLTPELRDAAMAQIFGSDAVRAANVLYAEGADGIAEWTSKVNDQGYAAEQAAKLNDNLSGDLEKLGGAFDTLMIDLGSGLQGPLRGVVQMFTDLLGVAGDVLGFFGDLPGPVQAGIAAFGAWGIAGDGILGKLGPLKDSMGGFFESFTEALGYARENGDGLSEVLGSVGEVGWEAAKGGLKELGKAIGPELGIAAATFLVGKLVSGIMSVATAGDAAREKIASLNAAINESDGIEARFLAGRDAIDELREGLARYQKIVAEADNESFLHHTFIGQFTQDAGEIRDARLSIEQYRDAIAELKSQEEDAVNTMRILGNQFGLTRDQVIALADKYSIDLTQGTQNAYLQFQRFYTTEYGQGPNNSTRQLVASMETMANVTSTAEERVDALKTALDILGGKQVSVFEATSALQQVVQSATGAMEGLSGEVLTADGHLNAYTESGQKAGDILIGVRDKGNELIETMVAQGSTIEEVRAADANLRQSFIDSAIQMGISREAAEALATEILGVPEERNTQFTAATDQAAAKIAALQAQIDAVSRDRTATINFRSTMPDLNGSASGTGRMGTFAEGGYTGPGGKYQPAGIVHAGEYVLTKEQTSRLGINQIEAFANRGYATGGLVTLTGNADTAGASAGLANLDGVISGAIAKTVSALMEPGTGLIGALNWAKSQVGKPYVWGSAGPGGYDCSGFMAAITNVIRGRSPHSRLGSTATMPWSGFSKGLGGRFQIGNTRNAGGGIGHMAGTLLGVNVESRGGSGVHVGTSARGAGDGLFKEKYSLAGYAAGTNFVPQDGPAYLHRGEAVIPAALNRMSREFASGGSGSSSVNLGDTVVKVYIDGQEFRGMARVEAQGAAVTALNAMTNRGSYNS